MRLYQINIKCPVCLNEIVSLIDKEIGQKHTSTPENLKVVCKGCNERIEVNKGTPIISMNVSFSPNSEGSSKKDSTNFNNKKYSQNNTANFNDDNKDNKAGGLFLLVIFFLGVYFLFINE